MTVGAEYPVRFRQDLQNIRRLLHAVKGKLIRLGTVEIIQRHLARPLSSERRISFVHQPMHGPHLPYGQSSHSLTGFVSGFGRS